MMMPQGMPMGGPPMGGPPPQGMPMGGPPMEGMPMGGPPPMEGMPMGEAPMEDMGEELAGEGRGGDEIMGHLTPGEIVIPDVLQDETLMEFLEDHFAENGVSLLQYTVGSEENSINPETGMPEFYNDPRRTYASQWTDAGGGGYWLYSGAEKHSGNKTASPTMEDYARFDKYLTNYNANRAIEERKIGELKVLREAGEGQPWFDNSMTPEYQALNDRYGKYLTAMDQRNQQGNAFINSILNPDGKFNPQNFAELSPYQQQGAWRHGERLGDTWSTMSGEAKKLEFENFMKHLNISRSSPYTGAWGGAGSAYGDPEAENQTPYQSVYLDQQEKQLAIDMESQMEAFKAQLEAQRIRLEEAAKERAVYSARLQRKTQSGSSKAAGDIAAAKDTVGRMSDPRSMISRSHARRSSSGSMGTLGFLGTSSNQSRPS
tara:strand:- start:8878 stop:10170 length:1293 start_codon:yes stop_codon:yes gene_type:complete